MRFFRTEVWSYAVLLIILFTIAAIAVSHNLAFLEDRLPSDDFRVAATSIWTITLGFMLIAGSFGLWAIKFSAQSESRRRIGRFVDAMDYFTDGMVVVDNSARITGSNPAVTIITGSSFEKGEMFPSACPSLTGADVELLLNKKMPAEVERTVLVSGTPRTLRFRSQPSSDLCLLVVGYVTTMEVQRLYNRQKERLQLVGHLARSMANDFNRLLFEISAHASLLQRVEPNSPDMYKSLDALKKNVEKGTAMAGQLLGLAQPDTAVQCTDSLVFHLGRTSQLLKDSLPQGWQLETSIDGEFSTINLTGLQVEQVIFNLGMLAADTTKSPGAIKIAVFQPGYNAEESGQQQCAAVVVLTTSASDMAAIASLPATRKTYGETGIILSVVKSIIEEAGGSLNCLTAGDGAPVYRLELPKGHREVMAVDDTSGMTEELKSYISQWALLIAGPEREIGALQQNLASIGAKAENVDNIISLLSRIEEDRAIDAMVVSKQILGQETKGLLKAILKLRPSSALVVLCEDPKSEAAGLANDVIFESVRSTPNRLFAALLEAKSLSASRKHR